MNRVENTRGPPYEIFRSTGGDYLFCLSTYPSGHADRQEVHPAGMPSIGVSHNGKDLHADVVVKSLELLELDAFDRLLEQTESPKAAGVI